jgi:leader peptidase (prepilin peptidase)/N-methyltransferase
MDVFVVGVLGLVFGSFASMMVYRIPREIPLGFLSHQRSFCPHCKKVIPFYLNLPLLGYVLSRAKCKSCKKKISIVYPLVEVLTVILFVTTYIVSLQSPLRPVDEVAFFAELLKNFAFNLALVTTVFIDIEFRIIPDRFSLGCWAVAILASLLWGVPSIVESLSGGALGFGIFFAMAWGYEKLKGIEGLGFGDVKMMGWLGSWIGIFGVPFVILVASLTGLMAGLVAMKTSREGLKTAIPFGPFLSLGAYVVWIMMNLGYWGVASIPQ